MADGQDNLGLASGLDEYRTISETPTFEQGQQQQDQQPAATNAGGSMTSFSQALEEPPSHDSSGDEEGTHGQVHVHVQNTMYVSNMY